MKKIILAVAVLAVTGVAAYVATTLIINNNKQAAVAVGVFYDPKPNPSYNYGPRKKDPCIEAKEKLAKSVEKLNKINENIRMTTDVVRVVNTPAAYAELKKHQDSLVPALEEYAKDKQDVKNKCNENGGNNATSTPPATTTPTSTPSTGGPSSKPTNPPLKATPPKK